MIYTDPSGEFLEHLIAMFFETQDAPEPGDSAGSSFVVNVNFGTDGSFKNVRADISYDSAHLYYIWSPEWQQHVSALESDIPAANTYPVLSVVGGGQQREQLVLVYGSVISTVEVEPVSLPSERKG